MKFYSLLALTLLSSLSLCERALAHGGGHPHPANSGGGAPAQVITKYESPLSNSGDFFNSNAPANTQQYNQTQSRGTQDRQPSAVDVPVRKQPRDSMFGN